MLLKLLRFIFGYVKVEIFGFAPERLMNLIMKNELVVWDVEHIEQGYRFFTGRNNLMKMKPFLQKTNTKMKVLNRIGIPYIIKKNHKRVAFVAGFGIFLCGIYILSLFVWEVRIVGEDKLIADNLLEYIEEKYVPLGTLKKRVNCTLLEEDLRKEFEDVSWISCELKGTGLTVYLEEGMVPQQKEAEHRNGDIVASKDATITKMITREGTPIAKVNQEVKKGDVLISGTIYIYDDNNEILETSYIAADGDVYGVTNTTYEDYVDLTYYDKKYSKSTKEYITLYFMNYCITPYTPKMNEKNYDVYTEIHKAKLLENFYLPFGYKKTKCTPYTLEHKKYSEKEAKAILQERLSKKIKAFTEKGVEIIENDVKIERNGDRMIAKGTLTLKESIVSFRENSTVLPNESNVEIGE